MKKAPVRLTARAALAALFLVSGLCLVALTFSNLLVTQHAEAAPNLTGPTQFNGTYDPQAFPACTTPRHHFMVPAGEARIIIHVTGTVPTNDLKIHLLRGPDPNPVHLDDEDTGFSSELMMYEPVGGVPAGEYQVQICAAANAAVNTAPFTYNGTFTTDNTAGGGSGGGTIAPLLPAPIDPSPKIGYEIFQPPAELVRMTSSSQGPAASTVEYMGNDAGEPSIGVRFNSPQDPVKGITAFQSDLQTVFAKFDDSCPSTGSNVSWYSSQAPTSQVANQDPIGFVDRVTGRTFAGQLTLLSPTCKLSFTDTDGKDPLGNPGPQGWVAETGPLGSGIDHQTIGGGPYHAPLPPMKPVGYPHAVYYASQDLVAAFALRSDDGGEVFGPVYPMWTTQCAGLHGHVKVTPNTPATVANGKVGTVFVPNNSCSGKGAVVVSETNGVTWAIRPVPQTTTNPTFQDPAVAIDDNGRVYFAMSSFIPGGPGTADDSAQLIVATSDDNGLTWQNVFDVSSAQGLKHVFYPAAVAGSGGRAAVAFLGAVPPGSATAPNYPGVWHLYVAHTFNGGASWTVTDATPNDPIQRGPIWAFGAADISRNLLDFFDITIDKEGRVQVGLPDGCADGHCVQAPNGQKGNAYTDRTTIARQSSGRRMFAANDPILPVEAVEPPGMPFLSVKRVGPQVTLSWSLGDDGNSPITGYSVLRGTTSGSETLLAPVAANQNTYVDTTATNPAQTYYYKVIAENSVGTSCSNNGIAAPYVGDTCNGLIVQQTPPNHPEQPAQGLAPAQFAIDHIAVAEPPATNNIVFKMKVTNMGANPPPNSRWRVVWNSYDAVPIGPQPPNAVAQQFYVGMSTDSNAIVKFEWGTVSTAVVGLIVGVPTEFEEGLLPGSSFTPDGMINLVIPKNLIGNPVPGDLLGAVNGRTFTGDTPETEDLQRSTLLIDHTFVKAQRDNGRPAATYTVVGNTTCPVVGLVLISAVSRKQHDQRGDFDVVLPLTGTVGVEPRRSPQSSHRIVVTFANPVAAGAVNVTGNATVSNTSISGGTVSVDLTNVGNAQTITLNLVNVNDGSQTGNVSIPMGVLLGDTNGSRTVNSGDAQETRNRSGQLADVDNFRSDVNTDGTVNSGDAFLVRGNSGSTLDPVQ